MQFLFVYFVAFSTHIDGDDDDNDGIFFLCTSINCLPVNDKKKCLYTCKNAKNSNKLICVTKPRSLN